MKSLFFIVISALLFSSLPLNAGSAKKKDSIEDVSRDAYVWGYPAVLMAHAREAMLEKTKDSKNSVNHFFHSSKIPDSFLENLLPVNPENLYSWAWVDLSKEPLVMIHPQMDDRFYSVQFVDAYSNVFQTISSATQGEKPENFLITPPGWRGDVPVKMTRVHASTPEILIFAQTFVKNVKEIPSIVKLEAQRQLIPLSSWNSGVIADSFKSGYPDRPLKINKNLAASGLKFHQQLGQILTKNPAPTKTEAKEVERFSAIGLKNQADFDKFSTDPEAKKMLERGIFEGERALQSRIASGVGSKINGWSYELKVPPFTEDYLLRAAVAQTYLYSSPPEESVQMSLEVDSEARQLNSLYPYILHFEKNDFPPARKMWSVRAFELKSKNSENQFQAVSIINNKTAKLKSNMDGSVDIYVQSEKPSLAHRSNWLPLSRDANFYVILTIFNPNSSALNRKYIAPSLTRREENGVPKQRITHTMMADAAESVFK